MSAAHKYRSGDLVTIRATGANGSDVPGTVVDVDYARDRVTVRRTNPDGTRVRLFRTAETDLISVPARRVQFRHTSQTTIR